jgi:hypothetical protein
MESAVVRESEGRWCVLPVVNQILKETVNVVLEEVHEKEKEPMWKRKKISPSPPPATG